MSCFWKFCLSSGKRFGCSQKNSCHMVGINVGGNKSSQKLSASLQRGEETAVVPLILPRRGQDLKHEEQLLWEHALSTQKSCNFFWNDFIDIYVCVCVRMCICIYHYISFYICNVVTPCCYCCLIIRCFCRHVNALIVLATTAEDRCFAPEERS